MEIAGQPVGPDHPTYVIAEAGSNHDGDLETAKELVDAAAGAGADAVKFQTFRADRMYVEESGTVEDEAGERSLTEVVAEAEMAYDWIPELAAHCDRRDVTFLSSPFDEESLDRLVDHVPAIKVASSLVSHLPFLDRIGETGKPVFVSSGAHEMREVERAVERLRDAGSGPVAVLHCVSAYPTPLEEAHVGTVSLLRERFDGPVGLSDHTLDPTTAPAASVALGGSVVEKHFTLDSSREGLDHSFALEPDELEAMVTAIRRTETALGSPGVVVRDVERDWYESARRSVQAVRDLSAGATVARGDVDLLRSGQRRRGLDPERLDDVVGAELARDVAAGDGVRAEDLRK